VVGADFRTEQTLSVLHKVQAKQTHHLLLKSALVIDIRYTDLVHL